MNQSLGEKAEKIGIDKDFFSFSYEKVDSTTKRTIAFLLEHTSEEEKQKTKKRLLAMLDTVSYFKHELELFRPLLIPSLGVDQRIIEMKNLILYLDIDILEEDCNQGKEAYEIAERVASYRLQNYNKRLGGEFAIHIQTNEKRLQGLGKYENYEFILEQGPQGNEIKETYN